MFVDTDEIGIDMIAEHLNVEKPITRDKLVQLLEEEGVLLSLNSILGGNGRYVHIDDVAKELQDQKLLKG